MSFSSVGVAIGNQEVILLTVPAGQTRLVTGLTITNVHPEPSILPKYALWKQLANGDRFYFENERAVEPGDAPPYLKGHALLAGESLRAIAYDYPPAASWATTGTLEDWAAIPWYSLFLAPGNIALHANLTTYTV